MPDGPRMIMKVSMLSCIISILLYSLVRLSTAKDDQNWDILDKRLLPNWYDKAKFGIFIHWGVFSVPSFGSEWFWYNLHGENKNYTDFVKANYPPGFTYQDFARMFTAEFFDPNKWAAIFAQSGAKYVVLTSKHHEGFTLFPSTRSFSWNSVDIGPHRDIVGELSKAVRDNGMKFGVYHSLYEWFNPIYMEDKAALFYTTNYVDNKLWPDLKQLILSYNPSVLWSDGDWEAYDTYWNSTGFLSWLYNESPVKDEIVVNDRWGIGIPCHHGDFYNCQDRYNPGKLQNHKWENAFTIDKKSWGYRRNADIFEIMSINEIITEIVSTVSCGGNVLLNVGPTKEGTISPIFQERLSQIGAWLKVNGEAIYETSPWYHQNDTLEQTHIWYTCTKTTYNVLAPLAKPSPDDMITAVYAIVLQWPKDNLLKIKDITSYVHNGLNKIEILGNTGNYLKWQISNGVTIIKLSDMSKLKSKYAWTLKFSS